MHPRCCVKITDQIASKDQSYVALHALEVSAPFLKLNDALTYGNFLAASQVLSRLRRNLRQLVVLPITSSKYNQCPGLGLYLFALEHFCLCLCMALRLVPLVRWSLV